MLIAQVYAGLVEDRAVRSRIWGRIEAEFALTCRLLLAVTGQGRLLERERLLRASIDRRNPLCRPDLTAPGRAPAPLPGGGQRRR